MLEDPGGRRSVGGREREAGLESGSVSGAEAGKLRPAGEGACGCEVKTFLSQGRSSGAFTPKALSIF